MKRNEHSYFGNLNSGVITINLTSSPSLTESNFISFSKNNEIKLKKEIKIWDDEKHQYIQHIILNWVYTFINKFLNNELLIVRISILKVFLVYILHSISCLFFNFIIVYQTTNGIIINFHNLIYYKYLQFIFKESLLLALSIIMKSIIKLKTQHFLKSILLIIFK